MTPHALVIDDNRDVADGLCNILSIFGIQARAAYGTRSAMLTLRQETPGLVLLDILMPGLDGYEVLAYLRREPRLANVPVFVVSTENQHESIDRALEAGATAYIVKPVSVEKLETELRKANLLWVSRHKPDLEVHMPIAAGGPAPDFTLPDENGELHTLSTYQGQPVVLYFYPKDDTPGWTKEARSFRDNYEAYRSAGITVIGVSADSVESHLKFKNKNDLPFTLLSDNQQEVVRIYDVWGKKKFMGREYEGIFRTTFLIGPGGDILNVYENVKPDNHAEEILAELDRFLASW